VIWSGCPFPTSLSSQNHLFALGLSPVSLFCISLGRLSPSSRYFDSQKCLSVSSFPATLTTSSQLHDNTTTLSPVFATLTGHVTHKSFACHSCRKHPGWGWMEQALACSLFPQSVACDPEPPSFTDAPGIASALENPLPSVTSVSSLKSTRTEHSANVDSKPLTGSLKPLDATLTKNSGGGTSYKRISLPRLAPVFLDRQHVHEPRATARRSPSQPALSPRQPSQYNPLFAHSGGIRHGRGRSENPRF